MITPTATRSAARTTPAAVAHGWGAIGGRFDKNIFYAYVEVCLPFPEYGQEFFFELLMLGLAGLGLDIVLGVSPGHFRYLIGSRHVGIAIRLECGLLCL